MIQCAHAELFSIQKSGKTTVTEKQQYYIRKSYIRICRTHSLNLKASYTHFWAGRSIIAKIYILFFLVAG